MSPDAKAWLAELDSEGHRLAKATDLNPLAVTQAAHRLVEWQPSCLKLAAELKLSPRDPESEFSASCELYAFARSSMLEMIES